jgi:hypothetical protein
MATKMLQALPLLLVASCHGVSLGWRRAAYHNGQRPTMFLGSAVLDRMPGRSFTDSVICMRKQKASDRRTSRRQRGEVALEEAPVAARTTRTASPMQSAVWKAKAGVSSLTARAPEKLQRMGGSDGGGRGRSRKRTTFYQILEHYHRSFLDPLTSEYQAEASSTSIVCIGHHPLLGICKCLVANLRRPLLLLAFRNKRFSVESRQVWRTRLDWK